MQTGGPDCGHVYHLSGAFIMGQDLKSMLDEQLLRLLLLDIGLPTPNKT